MSLKARAFWNQWERRWKIQRRRRPAYRARRALRRWIRAHRIAGGLLPRTREPLPGWLASKPGGIGRGGEPASPPSEPLHPKPLTINHAGFPYTSPTPETGVVSSGFLTL